MPSDLRIEPSVSLRINGQAVTRHQLEVLRAIYREGSQTKAAMKLGISVPVLNRYVGQLQSKVKCALVEATPTGTTLTPDGERVVLEFEALMKRMGRGAAVVVGGTPITEDLLMSALSDIDRRGKFELVISDDKRNLEDFLAGLMDLVILDDPLYLFDMENILWEEVAEDKLVHVDRGKRYMRFAYGAQRIGFAHLDSLGKKYEIEGIVRSVPALLDSGLSFFLNESLAARRGLKIRSDTDQRYLSHKINAVFREETKDIRRIINALQEACKV